MTPKTELTPEDLETLEMILEQGPEDSVVILPEDAAEDTGEGEPS